MGPHNPLDYHNNTLQIDGSKFDRQEIADAIFPPPAPTLPRRGCNTNASKFDLLLMVSIGILIIRSVLGMAAGRDESFSSLNSSIQLITYATIWALCYYMLGPAARFVKLYHDTLTEARRVEYINQQRTQPHNPTSISSTSALSHQSISSSTQTCTGIGPSHLATQHIINTDRKLTLFIFFIFNLLLFTLLVGVIEDFHGSYGEDPSSFPIKSIYDPRHPNHHIIPGHLDPEPIGRLVNPHKALRTYLQLYPHQNHLEKLTRDVTEGGMAGIGRDGIGYHARGLHIRGDTPTTASAYIRNSYIAASHGDENHHHHNHLNDHNEMDTNRHDADVLVGDDGDQINLDGVPLNDQDIVRAHLQAEARFKAQEKQYNANLDKLTPIVASATPNHFRHMFNLAALVASLVIHAVVTILTYPYATHLITTTPISTYFAIKKPTSLVEKWYAGLHAIPHIIKEERRHQLLINISTTQTQAPLPTPIHGAKWSPKWFYHVIYPYQLGPPLTIWQRLLYNTVHLLGKVGITLDPISLYTVAMMSLAYYIALFILMKDIILVVSHFESHYIMPVYAYYVTRAPVATAINAHHPPTFLEAFQILPTIFMMTFAILWLIRAVAFIFTLYWTIAATWSMVMTLLRSGVSSGGNGGLCPTGVDELTILQIGKTLQELQAIYSQQCNALHDQCWGSRDGEDGNGKDNVSEKEDGSGIKARMSKLDQYKLRQLQHQISKLLFERLHVWKLSHHISIVTLCLYYNDVILSPSDQLLALPPSSSSSSSSSSTTTTSNPLLPPPPHQDNPIKSTAGIPQWCIDVMRYIIHDNGSLGSGYNNSNINNGKLSFAMLLQLPATATTANSHHNQSR